MGKSEWIVKGGKEIVLFSNCTVGRENCVLMGHIGALLKDGRVKLAWTILIVHFLVFRSLSFAQFSVLQRE